MAFSDNVMVRYDNRTGKILKVWPFFGTKFPSYPNLPPSNIGRFAIIADRPVVNGNPAKDSEVVSNFTVEDGKLK